MYRVTFAVIRSFIRLYWDNFIIQYDIFDEYQVRQFDNEMSYDVTVAGWWIAVEGRASS